MAEGDDRTLPPSERRLLKAREEGQAPLSRELVVAAGLGAAALVVTLAAPGLATAFGVRLRDMLAATDVHPGSALRQAGWAWFAVTAPLLGVVALGGVGAVLLQTGFLIHAEALLPKLDRLDPRRGLKRVFGVNNLFEAIKALAKLAVLGWAVSSVLHAAWPGLPAAALWSSSTLMERITRELVHLLLVVFGCQCAIALADVIWTRWRFNKRLSMSREELRQEHREADGDPKIKARLRQLRQARARRRMLAAVTKATVVVTNPTHYAVALSYERGAQSAPRIVAKGVDEVAARIRLAAEKAGVTMVANPPLARALHALPLDSEVPAKHFKVVAEIIAYVWRLKAARGGTGQR